MRPNKAGPSTSVAHPVWEAPTFTKLPIVSGTGSSAGSNAPNGSSPRVVEPAAPGQPLSKLGFSFEMAFPMSSRSDK
jgi:hypothetical protein